MSWATAPRMKYSPQPVPDTAQVASSAPRAARLDTIAVDLDDVGGLAGADAADRCQKLAVRLLECNAVPKRARPGGDIEEIVETASGGNAILGHLEVLVSDDVVDPERVIIEILAHPSLQTTKRVRQREGVNNDTVLVDLEQYLRGEIDDVE